MVMTVLMVSLSLVALGTSCCYHYALKPLRLSHRAALFVLLACAGCGGGAAASHAAVAAHRTARPQAADDSRAAPAILDD
jgi:hypothetical protein